MEKTTTDIQNELRRRGITQLAIAKELEIFPGTVSKVVRRRDRSARVEALITEKLGFNPFPPPCFRMPSANASAQ